MNSTRWTSWDLETHDLENPRIIQIGAAYFQGQELFDSRKTYVNPEVPIAEGAKRVHGITDEMVSSAPRFADIASDLAEELENHGGNFIVGYNSRRFDVPATKRHFSECGISWEPRILDAYDFVNWKLRKRRGRKLVDLCPAFGVIYGETDAHDAGKDAEATGLLLVAMQRDGLIPLDMNEAADIGAVYAARLDAEWDRFKWYLYEREDGIMRMGYGKHSGVPLAEVDSGFIRWALGKNDTETDPGSKMPAEVEALFRARIGA